jgi:rhodanese-related sulfurtransferase
VTAPDEDAFVKQLLGGLGTYPPYFLRLRDLNRVGPQLYGPGRPALPALEVDDVRHLQRGGAWLIDARPFQAFAGGHLPGSVSIELRPQFATWLGWIAPEDAPLVFVLDADQDRPEVVRQCRNIGYEQLLGELDAGVDAWAAGGHQLQTIPLAPIEAADGTVVDVRQAGEYQAGHLPGAIQVELGALDPTSLPAGPLSTMCGHGERAMTAASLLTAGGRQDVTALIGGPEDWAAAHGPLHTGP